jgi:hypothetical protein
MDSNVKALYGDAPGAIVASQSSLLYVALAAGRDQRSIEEVGHKLGFVSTAARPSRPFRLIMRDDICIFMRRRSR